MKKTQRRRRVAAAATTPAHRPYAPAAAAAAESTLASSGWQGMRGGQRYVRGQEIVSLFSVLHQTHDIVLQLINYSQGRSYIQRAQRPETLPAQLTS